jgi:UrcA family protein
MIKLFLAATSLALLSTAAPAADTSGEIVLVVTAADLRGAEGERRFQKRLDAAIEDFCGSYVSRESSQWHEVDACRRSVVTSSRAQLARIKPGQAIRLSAR